MVPQTGLGKQLADGERNQAESEKKVCEKKAKLHEGVKRTQLCTNKPQKPPQLETDESATNQEKPVKQKKNHAKPRKTQPCTNKPQKNLTSIAI